MKAIIISNLSDLRQELSTPANADVFYFITGHSGSGKSRILHQLRKTPRLWVDGDGFGDRSIPDKWTVTIPDEVASQAKFFVGWADNLKDVFLQFAKFHAKMALVIIQPEQKLFAEAMRLKFKDGTTKGANPKWLAGYEAKSKLSPSRQSSYIRDKTKFIMGLITSLQTSQLIKIVVFENLLDDANPPIDGWHGSAANPRRTDGTIDTTVKES